MIPDGYCKGCRRLDKKYDTKGVRKPYCREAQLFVCQLSRCPLQIPGWNRVIQTTYYNYGSDKKK